MRRLVLSAVIILTTVGVLILLWEFREAVVLFAFSLAVSAAMLPPIDFLEDRGMPRFLAILLAYLAVMAIIVGLFFITLGPLLTDLERASNDFTRAYEQILASWPKGTSFQKLVVAQLPPINALYEAIAGQQGAELARTVFGFAQGFAASASKFFIVLILSIYWNSDRVHFERLWLSLLPARLRTRARNVWRSVEKGVGAYIRSEVSQSLIAFILLVVGYSLMGLRYPVILAFIGALLWLIPWLGAVLAVTLPLIVGLMTTPWLAAAAAIFTLVVLLFLEVVVEPRIFNRRRYSSLLIVIVVFAMADVMGLPGVIIGPPLAAAIQIFFRNLQQNTGLADSVSPAMQIATLQTQMERVHRLVTEQESPPPEIANLVERLNGLVGQTREILQDGLDETPSLGLPVSPNESPMVR